MNYPISAVSLSLLKTEPKPPATNEEELEKLHSLIELQKSKGHKYPLLACVFLLFRTAGKKTLTKNEMYNLMEKKAIEDKTKIVSSPTERYCVITQNNFKSKIKDIVKKKKWFTRALNDKGEIIYTLNDGVVCQISPKIESYLNIIEKRDGIFKNKAREEVVENIQKPKERIKKRNPKIKKIFKKYTPNNINANKLFVVTNNNLTNTNSINTLNTLNSENALNNTSSNININTNMNMEIEDNNIINNDNKKENENANNNTILNNNESKNNDIIENKEDKNDNNESNINTSNIINNEQNNNNNDMDSMDSNIISTEKNDNDNKDNNEEENNNINNINNDITTTQIENTETIIKPNSNNTKVITNNFLIEPTFANSNNTIKKNQSKKSNINKSINNKKKKKINKEKIDEKKLIRQSRSLSKVIEIKDNSDDFDIIIEDEREKSYINNNINNINTLSNNNLTEEVRNLNSEIEAILTGKKELNNSLTNIINNNTLTKKGTKNKKINKNYIEDISLDNTVENLDE